MIKAGWLLNVVLFTILMFAISVGGPASSRACKRQHDKDIARKGKATKAVITGKNTHKGNSVLFKYTYKGLVWRNREQNGTYFDDLNIGDTVNILFDSTRPSESFITSY